MSTYRSRGEAAQEPTVDMGNCRWCGTLATYKTLCEFGARCAGCFERYKAEPQRAVNVGDKTKHGPLAWAHALKEREEAGDRLSTFQQQSWRAALRRTA